MVGMKWIEMSMIYMFLCEYVRCFDIPFEWEFFFRFDWTRTFWFVHYVSNGFQWMLIIFVTTINSEKKKKKNSFYEFLISHNRNMYTRWALEAWQTCLPTLTHTCSYSRMIRFICWKMMKHSIVNWNVPTHSKTKVKSTATTMRTKTVSSSCGLN